MHIHLYVSAFKSPENIYCHLNLVIFSIGALYAAVHNFVTPDPFCCVNDCNLATIVINLPLEYRITLSKYINFNCFLSYVIGDNPLVPPKGFDNKFSWDCLYVCMYICVYVYDIYSQ